MGNIWHDMDPKRISPEDFIAVIEIPQGSKKKYELDKATGMIILDRILHTGQLASMLGRQLLHVVQHISPVKPCKSSTEFVAIPFNDPTYNTTKDLCDLPAHKFDEMSHFFSVYKALEGKETVAGEVNDRAAAVKIIAEAISNYRDTFC